MPKENSIGCRDNKIRHGLEWPIAFTADRIVSIVGEGTVMATNRALAQLAFERASEGIARVQSPQLRPRSVTVPLSEGQYTVVTIIPGATSSTPPVRSTPATAPRQSANEASIPSS